MSLRGKNNKITFFIGTMIMNYDKCYGCAYCVKIQTLFLNKFRICNHTLHSNVY